MSGFFKTKAGTLTIAFIAILVAFIIILASINTKNILGCTIGFFVIVIAMLYSPVKVHIIDRIKQGSKS